MGFVEGALFRPGYVKWVRGHTMNYVAHCREIWHAMMMVAEEMLGTYRKLLIQIDCASSVISWL